MNIECSSAKLVFYLCYHLYLIFFLGKWTGEWIAIEKMKWNKPIAVYGLWFDCYCRSNANGQIGNGTLEEVTVPVLVEIADPVKHVASGANHNLAITCEYFSSTLAIDESWHADEFFFSFNSTLAGFLQGNNSTY